MGPTPSYGARAEKPPKKVDFAMKQTNICRLSGDIIMKIIPVLAMSGSSADRAVMRSLVVGSSIGQQLESSDCARVCTEDTTPVLLASFTTH